MSKDVDWGIIHREGEIICECDKCGCIFKYEIEEGYPDFKSCQEELNSYGWISKKINGEWFDFCCEDCYRSYTRR